MEGATILLLGHAVEEVRIGARRLVAEAEESHQLDTRSRGAAGRPDPRVDAVELAGELAPERLASVAYPTRSAIRERHGGFRNPKLWRTSPPPKKNPTSGPELTQGLHRQKPPQSRSG